jgi:hypothetical protein
MSGAVDNLMVLIMLPFAVVFAIFIVTISIKGLLLLKEKSTEGMVKCNFSGSGKKVYHLPHDRLYDVTKIDESAGEFYAYTADEAEFKGFVRSSVR